MQNDQGSVKVLRISDLPYWRLGFGILKQNEDMTWDWKYARMQHAQTTKDDDNDRMSRLKKPAGVPLTTVICSFYFKLMEWA